MDGAVHINELKWKSKFFILKIMSSRYIRQKIKILTPSVV